MTKVLCSEKTCKWQSMDFCSKKIIILKEDNETVPFCGTYEDR